MATEKKKRRAKGDGSIFQRADGYWVAVVELPPGLNGKRNSKRIVRKSKADALTELRKVRTQVERGEVVTSRNVIMSVWCEHWLAEIAPAKLRPAALDTNRSYIANHILPAIGRKRLDRLTADDIRSVTRMMTRPVEEGGKGLATGTAKNVHWLMSGIIDDAVKSGRVHNNVVDRVAPPAVVRTIRRPLTYNECMEILRHLAVHADAARDTDEELAAVRALARWTFGIFTGTRQEDILGLTWDMLDLDAAAADIRRSLQWLPLRDGYSRGHGRHLNGPDLYPREAFKVDPGVVFEPLWRSACLVETKTRRRRIVPLIPQLVASLRRLHEIDTTRRAGNLVFTRPDGRPLRRQDDTGAWNELCRGLGIEGVHQHGARHTTATLLLEAGVPEDVRMAILGHSTAAAHRGYAHVDQSVTRAALEGAFGKMLNE